MNRREFIVGLAAGAVVAAAGKSGGATDVTNGMKDGGEKSTTTVALVNTRDRAQGIARAVGLLGVNPVKGRAVLPILSSACWARVVHLSVWPPHAAAGVPDFFAADACGNHDCDYFKVLPASRI